MTTRTNIYRTGDLSEHLVGYLEDGTIYRVRWDEGTPIGRVDSDRRIFRTTAHDEREVGAVTDEGRVVSLGLLEGGYLGWIEADGIVVRGGYIIEEEDVGRVDGPEPLAAGAALLLIFLPDEDEANRRERRR